MWRPGMQRPGGCSAPRCGALRCDEPACGGGSGLAGTTLWALRRTTMRARRDVTNRDAAAGPALPGRRCGPCGETRCGRAAMWRTGIRRTGMRRRVRPSRDDAVSLAANHDADAPRCDEAGCDEPGCGGGSGLAGTTLWALRRNTMRARRVVAGGSDAPRGGRTGPPGLRPRGARLRPLAPHRPGTAPRRWPGRPPGRSAPGWPSRPFRPCRHSAGSPGPAPRRPN